MNERIEAWLRARDAARFQSDMDRSARSVRRVGDAADHSARMSDRMERSGGRVLSVLGLIGRAAGYAALGVGALAAGGTAWGLQFNASMEQNEVAFRNFLGSADQARSYLQDLYKLASTTPFEFPQLVSGARRLLAFGFEAKEAKNILKEIGDTASGLGVGAEGIDRMVMAIGQIQAKGKLSTEELLQMAELGVPAFQILQKEFGITGKELESRLRAGSIGADKAIGALRKGMRKHFEGMSKDQAKTFTGQLSTLKDNVAKALGDLTKPLFDKLRKDVLPWLNKNLPGALEDAQDAVGGVGAGLFGGIAPTSGAGTMGLDIGKKMKSVGEFVAKGFKVGKGAVEEFLDALKPAKPFLDNVLIPLLKGFAIGVIGSLVFAFKALIFILKILAPVFGFLGKILKPFKPLFEGIGLVIGFLVGGPFLGLFKAVPKIGFLFKAASGLIKFTAGVFGFLLKSAFKVYAFIGTRLFGVLSKLPSLLGKAAGAVGRFASGAWNAVKSGIGKVLDFIKGLGSKFIRAGGDIARGIINGIKSVFGSGLTFVGNLAKGLANAVIGFLNSAIPNKIPVPGAPDIGLPANPIPTLGTGGVIGIGGRAIVGDRGMELAENIGGQTRITPIRPARSGGVRPISPELVGAGRRGDIIVPVSIDGREVARAVAKDTDDRLARA